MVESEVIIAQHIGPCGARACRDMVRPGEPMQKASGRWFHEECVPAEEFPDESAHPDQLDLEQIPDDAPRDWGEGEGPA